MQSGVSKSLSYQYFYTADKNFKGQKNKERNFKIAIIFNLPKKTEALQISETWTISYEYLFVNSTKLKYGSMLTIMF